MLPDKRLAFQSARPFPKLRSPCVSAHYSHETYSCYKGSGDPVGILGRLEHAAENAEDLELVMRGGRRLRMGVADLVGDVVQGYDVDRAGDLSISISSIASARVLRGE